ncbi:hypothetical protein ACX80U_11510 [Arthrobacter sp. TmT3-37]
MTGPLDVQHRTAMQLVADNALHPWDLWVEYVAVAGNAPEEAVAAYMYGRGDLPPLERNLLDIALQSLLEKEWQQRPHGIFLNLQEYSTLYDNH